MDIEYLADYTQEEKKEWVSQLILTLMDYTEQSDDETFRGHSWGCWMASVGMQMRGKAPVGVLVVTSSQKGLNSTSTLGWFPNFAWAS